MEINWILLITSISLVLIIIIKELAKERRIKLLKDIEDSKIEALGNYELKSSFKERLGNNPIIQSFKSIFSNKDEPSY